jgi:hypothetical protein
MWKTQLRVYFRCTEVFRWTLIGLLGAEMRCIGDTLVDVLHHLMVPFECPMVYFGMVSIGKCVGVFRGVLLVC